MPRHTARYSPGVSPGCATWGERSAPHCSGTGRGSGLGGPPVWDLHHQGGFPFPGLPGGKVLLQGLHPPEQSPQLGSTLRGQSLPCLSPGRAARPHPRGLGAGPPPDYVSVCLSPPDPSKMLGFEWQFHNNEAFNFHESPLPRGGGRRISPLPGSSLLSRVGTREPPRGRDTSGVSITQS